MAQGDVPWQPPTEVFNEQTKFDQFTRSVSTIDEGHRLIHEGMVFYAFDNEIDVPDGAFRHALFVTGEKPVHLKGIRILASEGPVNINFYEDGNVVLNSPIQFPEIAIFNANRLSSKTPLMRLFAMGGTAPTSPLGELFLGTLFVPANGSNGVTGNTQIDEVILKPNTQYILQMQNDPAGAGTADINVSMNFYELSFDE